MLAKTLTIGTRGSALALRQTEMVAAALHDAMRGLDLNIQVIRTLGDQDQTASLSQVGGQGVFTSALEHALRERTIDVAVHSTKDLPTALPDDVVLAAYLLRGDVHDVLISRSGFGYAALPANAVIGTSSSRRAAQIRHARRDLRTIDIRGNVDTRIAKALDEQSPYDAILLARAGLERLDRLDVITEVLPLDVMLPAPAQGAIVVQCRANDGVVRDVLSEIDDAHTRAAVTAERAFLASIGGGCALPIAAYAVAENSGLRLRGRITSPDGTEQIDVEAAGQTITVETALQIGNDAAEQALIRGARRLMEQVR